MANYTGYYNGESGKTYYVKPNPLSATPSWATDVVSGTAGVANQIAFTLDDTIEDGYVVFEQAGGSPAATDEKLATITPDYTVSIQATLNRLGVQVI